MWLNSIRTGEDGKPLSPVELLVLAKIPESEIQAATDIAQKLENVTPFWSPAPGTLYPILHRLHARGLINKPENDINNFRRSNLGNSLLSNSLRPLQSQIKETNFYYLSLIQSLIDLSTPPMGLHDFLDQIEKEAKEFLDRLEKLKEIAKEVKDKSVDVKVEFD